jgi:hypothetical protein
VVPNYQTTRRHIPRDYNLNTTVGTLNIIQKFTFKTNFEVICHEDMSAIFGILSLDAYSNSYKSAFRPVRLAPSCRASAYASTHAAVRLPMPLRMQLWVHLAACLFLMHVHVPSYSHQDRSTHAIHKQGNER